MPGGGRIGHDGLTRQGDGGARFVGARDGQACSGLGQVDGAVVVTRVAGNGCCGWWRGVYVQGERGAGGVACRIGADHAQGFCALAVAGKGGGVEHDVPGGGRIGHDGLTRQGDGGARFVGARDGQACGGLGQVDGAVVVTRVAGDGGSCWGRCVHIQRERGAGGVACRIGADHAKRFSALAVACDRGSVQHHMPGGGRIGHHGLTRQGDGGARFVGARDGQACGGLGQVDGAVVVTRVAGDGSSCWCQCV